MMSLVVICVLFVIERSSRTMSEYITKPEVPGMNSMIKLRLLEGNIKADPIKFGQVVPHLHTEGVETLDGERLSLIEGRFASSVPNKLHDLRTVHAPATLADLITTCVRTV